MKLNVKQLKDVETGIPVLATGTYLARISVTVEDNKAKTGQNLVVKHKILDPEVVKGDDGKVLENHGQCMVTRWISLVPTDKYDPDRAIKELGLACGIDVDNDDVTTEALEGSVVKVKVRYEEAEGANPARSDVRGWTKPTDDEVAFADSIPF
jgi:hypothetical protein